MKNIILSFTGGVILYLIVNIFIFYIDISFKISPLIVFIQHFKNNPINYVDDAVDAISFIYMPLSVIIVSTIISIVFTSRRNLYCLISVLPIILIEYIFILLNGMSGLFNIIKYAYLSFSYALMSYYIGYIFNNIIINKINIQRNHK